MPIFAPRPIVKNTNLIAKTTCVCRYKLTGVTRDASGDPLAGCTVELYESASNLYRDTAISDGSGNFTFYVTMGLNFYLIAYLAGSPDRAGITVNTLIGTLVQAP